MKTGAFRNRAPRIFGCLLGGGGLRIHKKVSGRLKASCTLFTSVYGSAICTQKMCPKEFLQIQSVRAM